MAEGVTHVSTSNNNRRTAFTLAEILITLGIIGIVAAMTIPNLVVTYKKKQTVSQLKKVNSVLSQLILRSFYENGSVNNYLKIGAEVTADTTKKFFNTYWLPYLKVKDVISDFQSPYSSDDFGYSLLDGSLYQFSIKTIYSNGRICVRLNDGTILLIYVMSWVLDENGNNVAKYTSMQRIFVDINGVNGPNTFGKDVFVFVVDFDKNVVRPYCYKDNNNYVNDNCKPNGNGFCCADKIIRNGWKISEDYPFD